MDDFLHETLGAFGLESSVPVLKTSFELDPSKEVKESCELALNRIRELPNAKPDELRRFNLLEAAPLLFCPVPELREVLLNEDNSRYERCSALFSLRLYFLHPTPCTEEAISAIIESLYAESAVLQYHARFHFML
ncbi:deoxyhypusine hydroxylase-A-like [Olea europaea var. sylvestris]|uniref:deoxyhypusine hydroxylase-A-like n=1 Tax=Olea europaea var. sylvestris TaxID=158386 RepID=UPI000C1D2BC1|nr:deoxyhypusine hydroxylase-A-like [Olea europaea var. sylvestris]